MAPPFDHLRRWRPDLSRRNVLLTVAGLLVLLASGWTLWNRWTGDDWFSEASSRWEEPDDEAAELARDHLASDGAELLALSELAVDAGEQVASGASEQDCTALAEEFGNRFAADQLTELLAPLGDPVISELWIDQSNALAEALTFCVAGTPEQSQLAGTIPRYQRLIDLRLDQLGVER